MRRVGIRGVLAAAILGAVCFSTKPARAYSLDVVPFSGENIFVLAFGDAAGNFVQALYKPVGTVLMTGDENSFTISGSVALSGFASGHGSLSTADLALINTYTTFNFSQTVNHGTEPVPDSDGNSAQGIFLGSDGNPELILVHGEMQNIATFTSTVNGHTLEITAFDKPFEDPSDPRFGYTFIYVNNFSENELGGLNYGQEWFATMAGIGGSGIRLDGTDTGLSLIGSNATAHSDLLFSTEPHGGTEVPEPTSMLLVGVGLASAALRRRGLSA